MKKKQSYFGYIVAMLITIILLMVVTELSYRGGGSGYMVNADVYGEVHHADGSVDPFTGSRFAKAQKGDRIIVQIPLDMERYIRDSVIYGSVNNCEIVLTYQEQVLFSYGQEQTAKQQHIGNVMLCGDIPGEAWGSNLTLTYTVADADSMTKLNTLTICQAKSWTKYMLGKMGLSYWLSVMILAFFVILSVVMICWRMGGAIQRQGLYLAVFCSAIMLWKMGSEDMFYVTLDNNLFCGNAEYIGLFAAPAAFAFFLDTVEEHWLFHRVMRGIAFFATAFFVITTVLNFFTPYHYCRFLILDLGIMGVVMTLMLVEFIVVRSGRDSQRRLVREVSFFYLAFALMDGILYLLEQNDIMNMDVDWKMLSVYTLYVYLVMLLVSYVLHLTEFVIDKKEKERLEMMAYYDGMTGVANRAACLERVQALEQEKDYTIVFVDANNLKAANDVFGHDQGDRLICFVASALQEIFEKEGFCGRYGGDEFIACIENTKGGNDRVEHMLRQLDKRIDEANREHYLPFTISVAYGYAQHKEGMTPDDVLRLADDRMYQHKRRMKDE